MNIYPYPLIKRMATIKKCTGYKGIVNIEEQIYRNQDKGG
jgi:hypothetical protein